MRKISTLLLFVFFGTSQAWATPLKVFHSGTPDHPCKLAKSVGGKWIVANERELADQEVSAVPSKANADYSNFKYNGIWYAVRSECLSDSSSRSASNDGAVSTKKYYVELRAQKYLMMGSGAGGGPNGTTGQTDGPLSSSLGLGARIGYYWKDDRILFLDINTLSATYTTTYTGTITGTSTSADSILMINVGLQIPFKPTYWSLVPYAAGSLGYAKFSENFTGSIAPGGSVVITDSSSTFDVKVEGGVVKHFTSHIDGVFSLAFTYLSFGTKTVDTSNYAASPVGAKISNGLGYSHLTTALGIRYSL